MSRLTKIELEARLNKLETQFDRDMMARGFDPAQAENVPLTPALAGLNQELNLLRAELAALEKDEEPE